MPGLFLFVGMAGWGCSCVNISGCQSMELPSGKDLTVFVGVVKPTPVMDFLRGLFQQRVVTFDVIEGLSGLSGREVGVETGMGMGDCGDGFAPGGTYLVFAVPTTNGGWTTNICMRNRRLADVPNDLVFLRQWMRGGVPGNSVSGILHRASKGKGLFDPPLEFAKIVATSGGKTFSARTNSWGWFQFDGLSEAGITLRVDQPGWKIQRPVGKIELPGKNTCLQIEAWASPD